MSRFLSMIALAGALCLPVEIERAIGGGKANCTGTTGVKTCALINPGTGSCVNMCGIYVHYACGYTRLVGNITYCCNKTNGCSGLCCGEASSVSPCACKPN